MKSSKFIFTTLVVISVLFTGRVRANSGSDEMKSNIVDLAASAEFLSTLVAAVKAGDLVATLKYGGPFTVFAPTNDAFTALPEGTLEELLKPENKAKLVQVLTYHVIPAEIKSSDLKDGMKVKTVEGSEIKIGVSSEGVKINEANVTAADVKTSNGIVHVIDKVIIPSME